MKVVKSLNSFQMCIKKCSHTVGLSAHVLFFLQSGESRPILACEPLTYQGCPFHTQSRWYHLLPIILFTCEISRSFLASVPTCLERVAAIKFTFNIYLQNINKVDGQTLNILSLSGLADYHILIY